MSVTDTHHGVIWLESQYERVVIIIREFDFFALMDFVYGLHLVCFTLWLSVPLGHLHNTLIYKHVIRLFGLYEFVVLFDTSRHEEFVSDFKDFIHRCGPIRHTWVELNLVGLFVDILIGILVGFVNIHELRLCVTDVTLNLTVFILRVVVDARNWVNRNFLFALLLG